LRKRLAQALDSSSTADPDRSMGGSNGLRGRVEKKKKKKKRGEKREDCLSLKITNFIFPWSQDGGQESDSI